jgi:hypothetical protein
MASVTQTIPTLWGGVSQQSDELKLPGQVNKALNVLPDVTQGLNKRPGLMVQKKQLFLILLMKQQLKII